MMLSLLQSVTVPQELSKSATKRRQAKYAGLVLSFEARFYRGSVVPDGNFNILRRSSFLLFLSASCIFHNISNEKSPGPMHRGFSLKSS